MEINIWSGIKPNPSLVKNDDINILINSIHKEIQLKNIVFLVSDPRYIPKVNFSKIPKNNFSIPFYINKSSLINKNLKNFQYLRTYSLLGRDGFSIDINKGFYHGCSSTFVAIQLACYLGFSSINVFGTKYNYGRNINRVSSHKDLPDVLISETQKAITKIKGYIPNIEIFFKETIF